MGWTWDDLQEVPQPIYDELIAYLVDEQDRTARARR
jgi:Ulp1 family protease